MSFERAYPVESNPTPRAFCAITLIPHRYKVLGAGMFSLVLVVVGASLLGLLRVVDAQTRLRMEADVT
jgi:hypothetical protein